MHCGHATKVFPSEVEKLLNITRRVLTLRGCGAEERWKVVTDLVEECFPLAWRQDSVDLAHASATALSDSCMSFQLSAARSGQMPWRIFMNSPVSLASAPSYCGTA